jgi:hypothetical protein
MRSMAAPVLAAKPDGLAARLDGRLEALPATTDDVVDPDAISAMMPPDTMAWTACIAW